jgi:hypothetical protein
MSAFDEVSQFCLIDCVGPPADRPPIYRHSLGDLRLIPD